MPGFIFYQGPSLIDGAPIVAIATTGTDNSKTGNIVQTWILRSDHHPQDAVNNGADESICGSCPLRGLIRRGDDGTTHNHGRGCYVIIFTAPGQVFRKYQAGAYPMLSAEHAKHFAGIGLRYGSYGDPVAVPRKAWRRLEQYCTGRSQPGYTHQWRAKRFSNWRTRIMASTHSSAENKAAHAAGWRTFRTVDTIADIGRDEIVCPASPEGGDKATCETCGACNGRHGTQDVRRSIAIVAHGRTKKGAVSRVIAAAK